LRPRIADSGFDALGAHFSYPNQLLDPKVVPKWSPGAAFRSKGLTPIDVAHFWAPPGSHLGRPGAPGRSRSLEELFLRPLTQIRACRWSKLHPQGGFRTLQELGRAVFATPHTDLGLSVSKLHPQGVSSQYFRSIFEGEN